MARETGQQGTGRTITLRETELKICELCGALNLAANPECFVCGWRGHFERETDVIRAAVELAVRRYGRLELHHLTDLRTYNPEPRGPLHRVARWLARAWNWLRG